MSCVEQMKYKLYLERISFKEARDYIEKSSEEVYYVDPGYKIFKDYYIIGVPPVAMGVWGKEMLFTFVKPCHGTFVMGIDSEEEIARLRENEKEKMKRLLKKGAMKDERDHNSFRSASIKFMRISIPWRRYVDKSSRVFASFREILGKERKLDVNEGATVKEVLAILASSPAPDSRWQPLKIPMSSWIMFCS